MKAKRDDVLKRLNYIEGHLAGIRRMIEEDQYCVDILQADVCRPPRDREDGGAVAGRAPALVRHRRHPRGPRRSGRR